MIILTNRQARQFILRKQGLLGSHKFSGKQGAYDYICQAGCIQFDPIDICGKNSEITLHARVRGFTKDMLHDLLYTSRKLFDYPDKQLSIIPVEYWPYFQRFRDAAKANLIKFPELEEPIQLVRNYIEENGPICSGDIDLEGSTKWWSAINWSAGGKFSRSVLEQMYSSGDLIVHHKKGTRRYYDLATRHIPAEILEASDPLPADFDHIKWRILRRIGAVGIQGNRASDAWLNIWGLNTETRNRAFTALEAEGAITEIAIEDIKSKFYICSSDMPIMEIVLANHESTPRCELIAPLDPFMWDRKLIKAIFDFAYSWEIYTPPHLRKYGVYVLPLLYGENFVGRVETVCDRKAATLVVKNIWFEDGVKQTKKLDSAISNCLKRFAKFNDCTLEIIS